MKILYFDVETTGIDSKIHEIVQLAGIVEIDGEKKEHFNIWIQPTKWDTISEEALTVIGKTREDLKEGVAPTSAMVEFKRILSRYVDKYNKNDKFYPAGHNVGFDLDFVQSFWKQHGDQYGFGTYQNWRALDTRVMANFHAAAGKLNCSDMKLSTLCQHFGIEIQAHDALSDIEATRQLVHLFMEKI